MPDGVVQWFDAAAGESPVVEAEQVCRAGTGELKAAPTLPGARSPWSDRARVTAMGRPNDDDRSAMPDHRLPPLPKSPPGAAGWRRPNRAHRRPRWSVRVATVAGIEIRIHVTFLLLVVFVCSRRPLLMPPVRSPGCCGWLGCSVAWSSTSWRTGWWLAATGSRWSRSNCCDRWHLQDGTVTRGPTCRVAHRCGRAE